MLVALVLCARACVPCVPFAPCALACVASERAWLVRARAFRVCRARVCRARARVAWARACVGVDGGAAQVRVWDLTKGAQLHLLEGHADIVYGVALSADGAEPTHRTRTARAPHSAIGLGPLRAGKTALSVSRDKTARVWNADSGKPGSVLDGHSDWVPTGLRRRRFPTGMPQSHATKRRVVGGREGARVHERDVFACVCACLCVCVCVCVCVSVCLCVCACAV
jgi:hypothetical protein